MNTHQVRHILGYDCERGAFRIELYGRDHLDRDAAILAAMDVLAIVSLVGGLSPEQRERLEKIRATEPFNGHPDSRSAAA